MKAIKDMTTAEMLCEYNVLTGKSVKKFASRAAGEKQLAAARAAEAAAKQPPKEEPKKVPLVKAAPNVNPDTGSSRGEAIAASWKKESVRAARSVRSRVVVDGTEYRSVAAAFQELDLPMKLHVKFRADLKAAGNLPFEIDGKTYEFSVVE